ECRSVSCGVVMTAPFTARQQPARRGASPGRSAPGHGRAAAEETQLTNRLILGAHHRELAMSMKTHLPHRTRPGHPPPAARADEDTTAPTSIVFRVQRTGAICVGLFLLVFG